MSLDRLFSITKFSVNVFRSLSDVRPITMSGDAPAGNIQFEFEAIGIVRPAFWPSATVDGVPCRVNPHYFVIELEGQHN
jgi:hypothetical protein